MKTVIKLSFCFTLLINTSVYAEVMTDGTLGAKTSLSGQMQIPQSLGTTVGSNLFHSFSRFNINSNEQATFTGSNTLSNVVSRVTGGQVSNIDGVLKSSIGTANFYFINPAGVTFGANAQLDVPAAFHVSTADTLRFADGSQFSATDPSTSRLTVAEPTGFGFLNTQGGDITVQDSGLKFKTDSTVSLSARNVVMNNGWLTVPSGNIQVYGTGNIAAELPLNSPVTQDLTGRVKLNAGSWLNTSGYAGGKINIQGGNIVVDNGSWVTSDTLGSGGAGQINIEGNRLQVSNAGRISSDTRSRANAGSIDIHANETSIDNGFIYSDALHGSTGNAGSVTISGQELNVLGYDGKITSDTYAIGHAGNIAINTARTVINGGSIYSNAQSGSTGHAGTITVNGDQLRLSNSGWIKSDTYARGHAGNVIVNVGDVSVLSNGQLSSSTSGSGNAGTVEVNAESVTIDNQTGTLLTGIISRAEAGSSGEAGTVEVNATGTVEVLNNGKITSSTLSTGDAGLVSIESDRLSVSNHGWVSSDTSGSGNAGSVFVTSNHLNVSNNGRITSTTSGLGDAGSVTVNAHDTVLDNGLIYSDALSNSEGNAGSVAINGNSLSVLNNGWISSDTSGSGNGGLVSIASHHLGIANNGRITSTTSGLGNAGSITVNSNAININKGSIYSDAKAGSTGNAGIINITADSLNLLNAAYINSDTYGSGMAGTINLDSDSAVLDSGYVSSDAYDSGNAGNVAINSDSLSVLNNGRISSDTSGSGNAGNISIESTNTVLNGGYISSDTYDSGNAGNVTINSDSLSVLNGSWISSDTAGSGNAGNINIDSDNIVLNSGYISSDTYNAGNAGNVAMNSENLSVLNGGWISSDTYGTGSASGSAGDIFVTADDLSVVQTGRITSDNTDGSGGDINLNVKHLTLNDGGAISTTTKGLGNAGMIAVQNAEDVVINGVNPNTTVTLPDGRQVTGSFSGFYLNTYGAGNGGNLQLNTKNLSLSDGGIISAIAVDNGTKNTANTSAGNILINADQVALNSGGLIATTTSSLANAGSVTVNAKDALSISGQFDRTAHPTVTNLRASEHSAILSNASRILNPDAAQLGMGGSVALNTANLVLSDGGLVSVSTEGDKKAGVINVNVANTLTARNGASVSSSTSGAGSAGNVNIIAPVIALDNANISAEASSQSQGQTGNVNVTANQAIYLSNHASISLKNDATIANKGAIIPSSITVTAPDIDLNNSKITTEATGNVDAGDINVTIHNHLVMDPAFITTTANTGNGGDITVRGGQLIYLQNSGFLTSVSGANSNGGNINVKADQLVMETGVIQANAVGGSGGDIDLNLKALIPSQNRLIIGGRKVAWHPFVSGLNVIQAASENGISGAVNVTSPQFDISASVSGLDSSQLVMPEIDRNLCQSSAMLASSLSRGGQGGIPADESQYGFVPPTATQSELNSNAVASFSTSSEKSYPCATLQP